MKLFREINEEVQILTEESDKGDKKYFIEGVFLQGNLKNRNGRVYPMEILDKEASRYSKNFIEQKRAFGELGHPDGPTINLERVSHMITSLHKEGDNYVGKAKIMDTPYGKIVKNLIDEGAKLGVSSRGIGSLEEKSGTNYVKDDFQLATAADIVADPSAPDAFVNGILEGKEWVYQAGLLVTRNTLQAEEMVEEAQKEVRKIRSVDPRRIEEKAVKAFSRFIQNL
jgi:hypothetical protein